MSSSRDVSLDDRKELVKAIEVFLESRKGKKKGRGFVFPGDYVYKDRQVVPKFVKNQIPLAIPHEKYADIKMHHGVNDMQKVLTIFGSKKNQEKRFQLLDPVIWYEGLAQGSLNLPGVIHNYLPGIPIGKFDLEHKLEIEMRAEAKKIYERVITYGVYPIALYWIINGVDNGFIKADAENELEPKHPFDTREGRMAFWRMCDKDEEWVFMSWLCSSFGRACDIQYYLTASPMPKKEDTRSLILQEWRIRFLLLIDSCYMNFIDHNVKNAEVVKGQQAKFVNPENFAKDRVKKQLRRINNDPLITSMDLGGDGPLAKHDGPVPLDEYYIKAKIVMPNQAHLKGFGKRKPGGVEWNWLFKWGAKAISAAA